LVERLRHELGASISPDMGQRKLSFEVCAADVDANLANPTRPSIDEPSAATAFKTPGNAEPREETRWLFGQLRPAFATT